MDSIPDLLSSLFSQLSWREYLLIVAIVMTIYFVVMVLRLMQLPRSQNLNGLDPAIKTPPPEFDAPPGSVLAGVWPQPVEPSIGGVSSREEVDIDLSFTSPGRESSGSAAPEFSQHLAQASISAEVRQLHVELAYARSEITRLRTEMTQLQAAQHVSPLYGEAMTLAVRGVDAAGIAGRCGISIAEAELVVALSRAPGTHKTGDDHGRH